MSDEVVKVEKPKAPWFLGANGATTFTRGEAQRFARGILESDKYRENLKTRAETGNLAPAIESMLWHYAYGKPVEQIAVTVQPGQEDLSTLPIEELQRRAAELQKELEEATALANAIPAEFIKAA